MLINLIQCEKCGKWWLDDNFHKLCDSCRNEEKLDEKKERI